MKGADTPPESRPPSEVRTGCARWAGLLVICIEHVVRGGQVPAILEVLFLAVKYTGRTILSTHP